MNIIKYGFGKKLKEARKKKKLTQEVLSEKLGINLRQLARIEAGESFVTAETLERICYALEISPSALFDFSMAEGTINKHNSKEYEQLKDKLVSISQDKNKLEFMMLAFQAMQNKKSLTQLKYLIKGLELSVQK